MRYRTAWVLNALLLAIAGSGLALSEAQATNATRAAVTAPSATASISRKTLRPIILAAAQKNRLEPALLYAVIRVESAYNPRAVSSAGAMGLMQLMPQTATRFEVADPFDPRANVNAGARYLRILLNKFGTIQLALAAYHAGEGRVRRGRNTVPMITATRKYVVSVIHHYMRYKKAGY